MASLVSILNTSVRKLNLSGYKLNLSGYKLNLFGLQIKFIWLQIKSLEKCWFPQYLFNKMSYDWKHITFFFLNLLSLTCGGSKFTEFNYFKNKFNFEPEDNPGLN